MLARALNLGLLESPGAGAEACAASITTDVIGIIQDVVAEFFGPDPAVSAAELPGPHLRSGTVCLMCSPTA
jgi:hypothetical protein